MSSPTTYTFFNKGFFTHGAEVYQGVLEQIPEPSENKAPDFTINVQYRNIVISENTGIASRELITGKFEGFLRHAAVLNGYHTMTRAKRIGVLKCGWSFVDFSSNEFTWRSSTWDKTFTLTDCNGEVIAIFHRAMRKVKLTGTLDVLVKVPESLLALILVTCKMVHCTVKEKERS
ncbi:hypothetical protein GGI12_001750 [Dipsacomyces acuminosporus]|nr:hypothetical protein GGI12_001750 [Dipsacomyces acuminosporus]